MNHDLRAFLYPIGLLASLGFGLRFFIQWMLSEKKKISTVTPLFWKISLSAHTLMTIHSIIQIQYPLAVIQGLNAIIAYRNLDLMGYQRLNFKRSLFILGLIGFIITLIFTIQSLFLTHNFEWMGSPHMPWDLSSSNHSISALWHLIGLSGIFLFASRFWIQWWFAEKNLKSELNALFWWISLFGSALSTIYFIKLLDVVNILSYATGLIPYIRNLMLLKKKSLSDIKEPSKSFFIFAGENSGDLIGSSLLKKLKPHFSDYAFYGVGGPSMREHSFQTLLPMENFKVMGFSAVFKALPKLYFSFRLLKKNILKQSPEIVILIDYPDFNMRLAKSLRKKGYKGKIVHYVCPSVWAWKKQRVHQLAQTLDLLLAIFPFEPNYFEKTSLCVKYVGHPLAKSITNLPVHKNSDYTRLGLFPGSRIQEIVLNLPLQLESAHHFCENKKDVQIFISSSDHKYDKLIHDIIKKSRPKLSSICKIIPSHKKEHFLHNLDLAIAKSGTITLELAFHKIPTIVTYKLSLFNYWVAKYLIKIKLPFYCIVNIIAGQEVFPEFINHSLKSSEIGDRLLKLSNPAALNHCKALCGNVHQSLCVNDSSETAAQEIKFLLKN